MVRRGGSDPKSSIGRIYELARKHCGMQAEWRVSTDLLRKKCGSISSDKEFRRLLMTIVRHDESFDHVPDYSVRLDGDIVLFRRRARMNEGTRAGRFEVPSVSSETYEAAREAAPGYDVHFLHAEWQAWAADQGAPSQGSRSSCPRLLQGAAQACPTDLTCPDGDAVSRHLYQ